MSTKYRCQTLETGVREERVKERDTDDGHILPSSLSERLGPFHLSGVTLHPTKINIEKHRIG